MKWTRISLMAALLVCIPVSAQNHHVVSGPPLPHARSEARTPGDLVLTNRNVRDMLGAGLLTSVVIAKIKTSQCRFDTKPSALAALKIERVPQSVILAMVQAPIAPDSPIRTQTAAVAPATTSVNIAQTDIQYLQGFPACASFLSGFKDFLRVATPFYNSKSDADRDVLFNWLGTNARLLADEEKECGDAQEVKNSPRGYDALGAEQGMVMEYFWQTLSSKQEQDYQALVGRYNQLVHQYNANLSYTRSVAYRLSVAQYFANLFQQPTPRSLHCTTSEDNGFGTTTSCSEW